MLLTRGAHEMLATPGQRRKQGVPSERVSESCGHRCGRGDRPRAADGPTQHVGGGSGGCADVHPGPRPLRHRGAQLGDRCRAAGFHCLARPPVHRNGKGRQHLVHLYHRRQEPRQEGHQRLRHREGEADPAGHEVLQRGHLGPHQDGQLRLWGNAAQPGAEVSACRQAGVDVGRDGDRHRPGDGCLSTR